MEEKKDSKPVPIIFNKKFEKANTYGDGDIRIIGDRIKRKKVAFVDRAQNAPLCTVFNYEQIEVLSDDEYPKSTSCTCIIS